MSKVGIFYGTTTGVTEDIAHRIADKIDGADIFNIDGNEDKLNDSLLNIYNSDKKEYFKLGKI